MSKKFGLKRSLTREYRMRDADNESDFRKFVKQNYFFLFSIFTVCFCCILNRGVKVSILELRIWDFNGILA